MIFFSEGLVHDPLRQKTIFLRNLIQEFLSEGYAVHLSSLQRRHRARSKKSSSVHMVMWKGSFGLPSKSDFLSKRKHLRRTMSVQQPDPPTTPSPKPDRSSSQPEPPEEHRGGASLGDTARGQG
ncbi:hypothetical protein JZ751_017070, partial [Albula glossodonta]